MGSRLRRGVCIAAETALGATISTPDGVVEVTSVKSVGLKRVVTFHAKPSQRYETNGLLSEE